MRTQQDRSIYSWNLHIIDRDDCWDGKWPKVQPTETVPRGLTTFQVSTSGKHPNDFCHFFLDDYRFERVWNTPERYIATLKRYAGAIAPDFSTYTDMPEPMQIWNVYRSRALARYWQRCGIDVIPCVQFAGKESYEWCFDGIPPHATIACSTVGLVRNKEARAGFIEGMQECIQKVKPKTVLMYGNSIPLE